jgi:hypothetical protein
VPRSGSTLLFNICRLIFNQYYGKDKVYATWCQFHQKEKEKDHNIIKLHEKDENLIKWSDKIITTVRDLRYILASYSDFNKKFNIDNKENLRNACSVFCSLVDYYYKIADYIFKYEEYQEDKRKIITEIINCLNLDIEKININSILVEIEKIKKANYASLDKKITQMHPNHISNKTNMPIEKRLTLAQIEFIEKNFSWYFSKFGYKTFKLMKML